MKTKHSITFFKLVAVLFMFFSSYGFINAQTSFEIDDPNIVYIDKDGNLMSIDSVKSFVGKGTFSMMKKDLGNGKMEIRLTRPTKSDTDEQGRATKDWISKLIDKPFPNFSLSNLAGNSIKRADLIDHVTVINFWFTGCQPCIAEMPELNKLVSSYEGQPVNFLAFSFNDKEVIEKFLKKHDFLYTQIPGTQDLIKELTITSYPTHMILDKTGVIKEIVIGASNDIGEKLKSLIEKSKGQ